MCMANIQTDKQTQSLLYAYTLEDTGLRSILNEVGGRITHILETWQDYPTIHGGAKTLLVKGDKKIRTMF